MSQPASAILDGPALSSEVPSTTIPQFIGERARRWPGQLALVDGISGRSYRYDELVAQIVRVAAGLVANGFKAGDTLLMFAPNLPEWPIAALGAMAAGGVVSGANPMNSALDLAQQMRDASARFVFTVPGLLDTVRAASQQAPCEQIVVLGHAAGTLSFADLAACPDPQPKVANDPDALAALPYSSGTTGLSKGVILTHRNLLSNICQCLEAESRPLPRADVSLALLPMFHIFGFALVSLCGLASGATIVTLPRFEPESFLQTLERYRVTQLFVVPPLMQFLAAHPLVRAHDLSSLKAIACGGAPMGAALEQKVSHRLGCTAAQGYGMTESSGVIAVSYPDRSRPGSVGQLLPATQARIVDPLTGEDLPRGSTGELWFRGPQAFRGYRNQPAATAASLTEDGWVKTGDIAHFDDDGYLFITDRLKDLLKVKGFQVAPAELETILLGHPQVVDAAVIGRPDERAGELPVAYVVVRGPINADQIKSWLAQRVLDYKHLGDVVFCEAIPKTPAGKILRRALRVQDAQRAASRGTDT
jgi:acyl-CoA synthetase (AMP-forming)/AMP-acid ligase II